MSATFLTHIFCRLTDDSVIATCGRDKTVRIFLSKIDFACVFAPDGLIVFVHAGMRVFVHVWERTNAYQE
jgi:hypothetical protein